MRKSYCFRLHSLFKWEMKYANKYSVLYEIRNIINLFSAPCRFLPPTPLSLAVVSMKLRNNIFFKKLMRINTPWHSYEILGEKSKKKGNKQPKKKIVFSNFQVCTRNKFFTTFLYFPKIRRNVTFRFIPLCLYTVIFLFVNLHYWFSCYWFSIANLCQDWFAFCYLFSVFATFGWRLQMTHLSKLELI